MMFIACLLSAAWSPCAAGPYTPWNLHCTNGTHSGAVSSPLWAWPDLQLTSTKLFSWLFPFMMKWFLHHLLHSRIWRGLRTGSNSCKMISGAKNYLP